MTLSDFYLICFVAGFCLSLVSFLGGSFHLPHLHVHIHAGAKGGASPVNFGSITAFLAWFGGTGFLLTRFYSVALLMALGAALLAGLLGAALVSWFVVSVLAKNDQDLDPADYDMLGVLGRVSSTVRPDGIGEMIFSQQGTRRGVPVRSDEGKEIPKGVEVVVTRYEKGVAYVREFSGF